MVVINSIRTGIVIDHITAGLGVKILALLDIDTTKNCVAFIMNAASGTYGRKDLIKIENVVDIDLAALGLIDPKATVNIIEDHVITKKINLELPIKVKNIIQCRNPRCVTSIEPAIPHIFHLVDGENREYQCEYCDDVISVEEGLKHESWRKK